MTFHLKTCSTVGGYSSPMYPVLSREEQGHIGLLGINGTSSLTEAQELAIAMIKSLETIKNVEEQVKELQTRLAASLAVAELESKQKNDPLNIPITGILKFVPISQEAIAVMQQHADDLSPRYRGASFAKDDVLITHSSCPPNGAFQYRGAPSADDILITYPSAPPSAIPSAPSAPPQSTQSSAPPSGVFQMIAAANPMIQQIDAKPNVESAVKLPAVEEYISICRQCKSPITYIRLVDGVQKCSNCDDTDRLVVTTKDINEGKYPVIDSEDVRQFKENKKLEEQRQIAEKERFCLPYTHIAIGIIGLFIGSFLGTILDNSRSSYRNCRRY